MDRINPSAAPLPRRDSIHSTTATMGTSRAGTGARQGKGNASGVRISSRDEQLGKEGPVGEGVVREEGVGMEAGVGREYRDGMVRDVVSGRDGMVRDALVGNRDGIGREGVVGKEISNGVGGAGIGGVGVGGIGAGVVGAGSVGVGGIGVGAGVDVKVAPTTTSSDITQTIAELSRRRLANDPAMMRELKRYRKLMLLTLLPSITSENTEQDRSFTHNHPYEDDGTSHCFRGQPDGTDDPFRDPNEHLPRPEPTDAVTGGSQGAKSAESHRGPSRKSLPSGPASAGTRLPLSLRTSLDTSPRASHRRRSHEDTSPHPRSRRTSHSGDRQEGRTEESDVRGVGTGELDLLTLAALYLESRQRVLGREWYSRSDLPNTRPSGQLGGMGVARPRRLSPLSPQDTPLVEGDGGDLQSQRYSAVVPTPAGLHLSVNYTQNLSLHESMYLAERARALRPRLRRLSSMDDLVADTPSDLTRDLHKATSAPDLSGSGHGRSRQDQSLSRVSSQESLSPPLVTPARANTPTDTHSTVLARPQIVGGSLATNSTVDTARTVMGCGQGREGLSVSAVKNPVPQFPEASRSVLPPRKLPFRSPKAPAVDARVRDLPLTPPPTAAVEGVRRGGRVHLEPLTARKISQ